MAKAIALEVPPPGAGLITVTADAPVETMLEAGMAAINCVELMNVVAGADPPKLTVEDATKFVPAIASVKAAPPASILFGEIAVIVGVGLGDPEEEPLLPPPHPQTQIAVAITSAMATK